jgi:hypothetical protein
VRSRHLARLLVARHPAEPRITRDRLAQRGELEHEALAVLGVEAHAPAGVRRFDGGAQPRDLHVAPAPVATDRLAAAGERGHRLASREQQAQGAALPVGGAAEAGEAVQLRIRVAEGEGDAVGRLAGADVLVDAHLPSPGRRGSTSTAVPS